MRSINIDEFVEEIFNDTLEHSDNRYVFFLGAGCSVTSGISTSGPLAKNWIVSLERNHPHKFSRFKKMYPDCDIGNPLTHYFEIFETLFHDDQAKQKEIKRICHNKTPGFGYYMLTKLMQKSTSFNAVVTTNFDDLIKDAFIYTGDGLRPLVITHHSISNFIDRSYTPIIVKAHGDAHLKPANDTTETKKLPSKLQENLQTLFLNARIVFVGYKGNDHSITDFLNDKVSKPQQVYWIGDTSPNEVLAIHSWWDGIDNKTHVMHQDFDDMMLNIQNRFTLSHPDFDLISNRLQSRYLETFDKLSPIEKINTSPDIHLKKSYKSPMDALINASRNHNNNPDLANMIYLQGIKQFPDDVNILGAYANFLSGQKNYKNSEKYFKLALKIDPKHVNNLGAYAFSLTVQKRYDEAEEYYKKALDIDHQHNLVLNSYIFLLVNNERYIEAGKYAKRALKINPKNDMNLHAYALFLSEMERYDEAEEYYKKALDINSNNVDRLRGYATFLADLERYDEAEEYYKKALNIDSKDILNLEAYAILLERTKRYDESEQYCKQGLTIDPHNSHLIGVYALVLTNLKQYKEAEEYYKQSLDIDPKHVNHLGNYAIFLENKEHYDEAEEYYNKAIQIDPKNELYLANYTQLLFIMERFPEAKTLLDRSFNEVKRKDILFELWFYSYAHVEEYRENALQNLQVLLEDGVRSNDMDFTKNIQIARKHHHPDIKKLQALSDLISDKK